MSDRLLDGLTVLVLEDEFLIAMDVEHLCTEHGAAAVHVVATMSKAVLADLPRFDVGIIDLMLDGQSTLPFADELKAQGIPFVFASGYPDRKEFAERFPGVAIVTKPYSGEDLIEAAAAAHRSGRAS
ncbi:MAG: response regulator [Rhizobiaceae bacterium]